MSISNPVYKEELIMSKWSMFNPEGENVEDMKKNIGKKVIFTNPSCPYEKGTFTIKSIQTTWSGKLAYRVYANSKDMGKPAEASRLSFLF